MAELVNFIREVLTQGSFPPPFREEGGKLPASKTPQPVWLERAKSLGCPFPEELFAGCYKCELKVRCAMKRINEAWEIALASGNQEGLTLAMLDEELLLDYLNQTSEEKGAAWKK